MNQYSYVLEHAPYMLSLSVDEIEVLDNLVSVSQEHPDETILAQFQQLVEKLSWYLPESQAACLPRFVKRDSLLDEFAEAQLQRKREQLTRYRGYCAEAMIVEVSYLPAETFSGEVTEPVVVRMNPSDVIIGGATEQHILLGVDQDNLQQVKIPLEQIVEIKQLPFKVKHKARPTTVVFQLTGRLAKTYRLYPDEMVVSQSRDRLRVSAKTYDVEHLLQRLLKYQNSCEVLSPIAAREAMVEKIKRLLVNL